VTAQSSATSAAKAALELLLDLSIWCGESDYTADTTPLTLLEDLFDLTVCIVGGHETSNARLH
jgi:hypothetical protein